MIKVEKLEKRYPSGAVLRDVSFELGKGDMLVLTGANGAGRTTLLEILAAMRRPSAGRVEIDGVDASKKPLEVRKRVGFAPQIPKLYEELTVGEHMDLVASARLAKGVSPKEAVERCLDLVSIEAHDRIDGLSAGRRQQLAIASALLGEPPVLLLDEPFAFLDGLTRDRVVARLETLRAAGGTLVLACNLVALCERLEHKTVALEEGRLVEIRSKSQELESLVR